MDYTMTPNGTIRNLEVELANARDCIRYLTRTVLDLLPQIGSVCIQDFDSLNNGLILSERIIGRQDMEVTRATVKVKKGKA